VLADADAVVEALLNLLQNAVRYCPPPRRILLTVSTASGNVGLSVEDDGPGIPSDQRDRIFERFYRGDAHKPRNKQLGSDQGSGLGLAIVQAVVRGHGGSIELATETGKGSRFTLWLKRADVPDYAGSAS
jgi:signal transduction histidine kinase